MCIHFLVILSLKILWAGVKHWRTAPHRFYVYRKPISSPRSRNLKVIKKMCTFEVHLCMMSGQLILSGISLLTHFPWQGYIAIASDPHAPFQYHQGQLGSLGQNVGYAVSSRKMHLIKCHKITKTISHQLHPQRSYPWISYNCKISGHNNLKWHELGHSYQ